MQSIISRYSSLPGNHDLVFRSLCALLSEQPEKVDWTGFSPHDWQLLNKMATEENVAPIAYYLLHSEPEKYHRSEFDQATFQVILEREAVLAVRNAIMFKQLDEILQAFLIEKIPVVLLKGADLARSLYPEPGLRWLTDLDLLISKENLKQGLALVHHLGYHEYLPEAFPGLDRAINYHSHMMKDGKIPVLLELHWSLVGSEEFQYAAPVDWFWQNLEPCQLWRSRIDTDNHNNSYTLNPTANLLYLSAHQMLQHGGELASLQWLLDIHRLIQYKGDGIDWRVLADQAILFGWAGALEAALSQVHEIFDSRLPDGLLAGLNYQKSSNDALVHLKSEPAPTHILEEWKKLRSLSWKGRILLFLALTFPSPAYIHWRYNPHPSWIWPIFYGYRWIVIACDGIRTVYHSLRI